MVAWSDFWEQGRGDGEGGKEGEGWKELLGQGAGLVEMGLYVVKSTAALSDGNNLDRGVQAVFHSEIGGYIEFLQTEGSLPRDIEGGGG